jgi:tRNA nucleotidyltransferase (CCA-adding enzyme)
MQIYLVGGAVRDQLLELPIKERDWVVVGASPEEMLQQGFKPVGKDFPVFLHPKTHEEYALARTERKTSQGYKGFQFYTSPDVTLEQDLARRDLTINAIAQDQNGKLIDPFHGQQDLKNKILRHTTSAFIEDPVRILRVARFAARLYDFTIAHETLTLMKQIVSSGEINALVAERVWQELQKALTEPHPERFIEVLRDCQALKIIFPEIDALFGIPNPEQYHPEIDSGIHTLIALQQAAQLTEDPMIRFAVLMHDVGKAQTPKEEWPHHQNHCQRGAEILKIFCKRWHVPKLYKDLAGLVTLYHCHCNQVLSLNTKSITKLLKALDPFRRPQRFEQFLIACAADVKGRKGLENTPYPQADFLRKAVESCRNIKIDTQGLSPQAIAQYIHKQHLTVIEQLRLNVTSGSGVNK